MEKNNIQLGLFVDVLYSQNPFDVKGFLFFIANERREKDKAQKQVDQL